MSRSGRICARRIEIACVAVVSMAMSGYAFGQEQQSQPPSLPPVFVESPAHRPASAVSRSALERQGKPRRTRREEHRRAPPVDVAAQQAAAAAEAYQTREGSEARGYKLDTASNFGPWGQKPILDVPFSVNVISSDFIQNRMAFTPDDIFKVSPVAQPVTPSNRGLNSLVMLRGFQSASRAIDGMRTGTFNQPFLTLEDKERVEIYTGLTGFLYGGTDVGGLVNYVYKKPTLVPYASVNLGNLGNTSGIAHLDLGGPIDKEGKFAYRLNIVGQDGALPYPGQSLTRYGITGVFDWNVTPDTKIELLGSHQDGRLNRYGGQWIPGGGFDYNFVPNPHQYWGQLWSTGTHRTTDRAQISINSKIDDVFTFRAAYSVDQTTALNGLGAANFWIDNNGTYRQNQNKFANEVDLTHSAYAFVDATFATGPIEHKVTTGFYGNFQTIRLAAGGTNVFNPVFNAFNGPTYIPQPIFAPTPGSESYYGQLVPFNYREQKNYIIGDDLKFNEYWSALVGVNFATIATNTFNAFGSPPFGQLSSAVDQSRASPSLALTFKPASWMSTYVSYNQSLQAGTVVPNNPIYTNANTILPAYVGEQYELGAKADVGGVLLTGALFQIDKANEFAQVNPDSTLTFVQDGRQVHKGVELTATGNIMEGLRILGGLTFMNARVVRTASPATDNKLPVNVSEQMAKATLEYDLPFLHGLTLTGGVYYYGRQAADNLNTVFVPPSVIGDLGVRYRTILAGGHEAIFRLNVSNVTDRAYWVNSFFVGQPRTVAFSGQFKF